MQLIISRKNSQDSKVLLWILVFVFLKKESDYIFRSLANSNKQKEVHYSHTIEGFQLLRSKLLKYFIHIQDMSFFKQNLVLFLPLPPYYKNNIH